MRAVSGHDVLEHFIDDTNSLHGSERFVINRNRSRLSDGAGVSLYEDGFDVISSEEVGKRQAGRATRQ